MARGWESKNVEEQLAEGQSSEARAARAQDRNAAAAATLQERERQGLLLQRERILDERTSNPHRRQALQAALAQIEEQLGKLG